jgi:hypothetical protein
MREIGVVAHVGQARQHRAMHAAGERVGIDRRRAPHEDLAHEQRGPPVDLGAEGHPDADPVDRRAELPVARAVVRSATIAAGAPRARR